MISDPVCGMRLDLRDAAAMAIDGGRAYYFCCTGCHERFLGSPEQYRDNCRAERLSLGVMGSASEGPVDETISQGAWSLGRAVAESGLILITGACPGLPYQSALGTRANGGLSVGISPALSLDEHVHQYDSPADAYDVLIYTGSGLMGREVTNIRSSDMVAIVGGSSGTLGEFAIAYDEGKLIGVLQGCGGIGDTIPDIVAHIEKDTGALVIYQHDPQALVTQLLDEYAARHFRRPSCFCSAYHGEPGHG